MGLKNIWGGGVSIKGVVLVALTSLAIGLGISGSLDWLVPSRAVNLLGDAGQPDRRTFVGLPDFVNLAKKIKPIVVNISTTQMSEGARRASGIWQPVRRRRSVQRFLAALFRWPAAAGPAASTQLGFRFYHR